MKVHGLELTFVVYPALISSLPFPQFWSVLFFTMLTSLGLGTIYILIEIVSDLIHGTCKRRKTYKGKKVFITFFIWAIILALNLTFFASSAGYYWIQYMDHYATSVNLVIFLFVQFLVLVYMLPLSDLVERVQDFGESFPKIYVLFLKYICPPFALFLASMAVYGDITNKNKPQGFFEQIICYSIMFTPTL